MLPLAHGALGYLDELLPFFLIAGFAIILVIVMFLSRKTENTLSRTDFDSKTLPSAKDDKQPADPKNADHFRLD